LGAAGTTSGPKIRHSRRPMPIAKWCCSSSSGKRSSSRSLFRISTRGIRSKAAIHSRPRRIQIGRMHKPTAETTGSISASPFPSDSRIVRKSRVMQPRAPTSPATTPLWRVLLVPTANGSNRSPQRGKESRLSWNSSRPKRPRFLGFDWLTTS
jgi:hypothetical protein